MIVSAGGVDTELLYNTFILKGISVQSNPLNDPMKRSDRRGTLSSHLKHHQAREKHANGSVFLGKIYIYKRLNNEWNQIHSLEKLRNHSQLTRWTDWG